MAKIITFFNSKGGVGKTALAALYADYLSYRLCWKVLVIDMDGPQFNLMNRRKTDQMILKKPDSYLARYASKNQPYDILTLKDEYDNPRSLESIKTAVEGFNSEYNIIIIDFPGHYTDNDSSKYMLWNGVIDNLIIPVNAGIQSQEHARDIIKDTHSMEFKRKSGRNAGQPTLLLWNRISAEDRKRGLNFRYSSAVSSFDNIDFIRMGINDIESLSDKREPTSDRFIFNTVCYPQQNINRTCGYIEKIFAEITLRITGQWNDSTAEALYNTENK